MVIIWILVAAAFVLWLVLVIAMMVRDDNRIRRDDDPWLRGLVVRTARLELAAEGQQTARLLERASVLLDG